MDPWRRANQARLAADAEPRWKVETKRTAKARNEIPD